MATAKEETPTLTLNLMENVKFNGAPAELTLGEDGALRWLAVGGGGGGGGERRLGMEEVLGIEAEGRRLIRIRAFVGESEGVACAKGERVEKRARRDYVFEMPTDEAATRWNERLRDQINSLGRPKHLFIIVNPFGGNKCGSKIFQTAVKSLLDDAGILYTIKETMHQLHAQEIAYSLDISQYDGIVCVSGDGVLAEVVNGLLHREDWEKAIKMPLGVIPAGTGNGMAKSLLHSAGDLYSVSNAVFAIIRGHKCSLDVATITQGETKFFSVLLLTWGLVADIDIESEKYRWMGSARLEFYALLLPFSTTRTHSSPSPSRTPSLSLSLVRPPSSSFRAGARDAIRRHRRRPWLPPRLSFTAYLFAVDSASFVVIPVFEKVPTIEFLCKFDPDNS